MPHRGGRALRAALLGDRVRRSLGGKDRGGAKLYTARDVKIIARIRELLYDEGFTVAGAKKRLEAEIVEGRFDHGLAPAPPVAEQRKGAAAPASPAKKGVPTPSAKADPDLPLLKATAKPVARAAGPSSDLDRRSVVRELKEIVKMLDRGARRPQR